MFSEELEKYDWDEVTACINAKTEADVRRALTPGRRCTVDDFMALISPAAETLFGNHGAFEPSIYRRAFWTYRVHVHSAVYHQLLHKFLRVLRFPRCQQDEAYDFDGRRNRQ